MQVSMRWSGGNAVPQSLPKLGPPAFDFSPFPGLYQALKGFKFIDRLRFIQDPMVLGTYLFKGEFDDGRYGLFIWDSVRKDFIQEPATIDDYGFKSIAQVYKKYPGLRLKK